jgi:hypothetical protein
MALAPVAAAAQQLGGGARPEISIIRVVAALILCLAAAFAAILLLRRRGALPGWLGSTRFGGAAAVKPRMMVIESRRLSPHADLWLVRCDAVDYLILCGTTQAQLLSQHPAKAA